MPRSNKKSQRLSRNPDAAGAPLPTRRFARNPAPPQLTGANARMRAVPRKLPANTRGGGFRG